MKLIGLSHLYDFCQQYPDTETWIRNWIADARAANWKSPHELKQRYPSCSLLGGGTVFFNVRGNNYRMETQIAFNVGVISVRWIGTHEEYTKRNR